MLHSRRTRGVPAAQARAQRSYDGRRAVAGTAPRIEVEFPDMPYLGVWSKPGAGFICIEPWHGYVSLAEFDGEFTDKPGLMHIAPGEKRTLSYRVRVG